MATTYKYLDIVGLEEYSNKIKTYIDNKDALAIKYTYLSPSGADKDTLYFFKVEPGSPVDTSKAYASVSLNSSEVEAIKTLLGNTTLTTTATTITGAVNELDAAIKCLAAVAKSGLASDVNITASTKSDSNVPPVSVTIAAGTVQSHIEQLYLDVAVMDKAIGALSGLATDVDTLKGGVDVAGSVLNSIRANAGDAYYDSTTGTTLKQAISALGASVTLEVVASLPAPASAKENVIYLVPSTTTATQNIYDEYIFIKSSGIFEKIGTTQTDLSGYLLKTDIITNTEIDTLVASVFK